MTISCKNCGTSLADDVKFCTNCGARTADGVADAPPSTPATVPRPAPAAAYAPTPEPAPAAYQPQYQQPYPPQKSNTPLIVALVGALVLLAALGTYLFTSRSGDSATPDGNMAAASDAPAASGSPANASATVPAAQPYNGPAAGAAVGPEVVKYVSSDANIRNIATAQSPSSQVTGKLKRGDQVKGVMHQGLSGSTHWLKLSDGRGYVSAINLGDGPPAAVAAVNTAQARRPVADATYCTVVTRSGNLRIRSGPNGRIIGGMPPGARFQAYGGDYDASGTYWVQVQPVELRYPVGWVSADHVAC